MKQKFVSVTYTGWNQDEFEYREGTVRRIWPVVCKANRRLLLLRALKRFGFDQEETIQRRACRTILEHQFRSYLDAIGKCNLEYLKDRRETYCKKFAQGLGDNVRTCHLLLSSNFQSHDRNLRNSYNLSQYPMKTSRFRNNPVHYFVSLLNKTQALFQNCSLLHSHNILFLVFQSVVSGCPEHAGVCSITHLCHDRWFVFVQ